MRRTALVRLRNVSAEYDGKKVLSNVSLDIYDDDFLGVIGPNGGGKTTLVKIITGLIPYSGTAEYAAGLTVDGVRRIGYLPQQSLFDRSFPISVADVVVSGLQTEKGFAHRYTRENFVRARKLLEMTGIAALEKRPIGEISGGQMQRALLCRALIAEPRLLILDEPATYIDSRFEGELYEILRELSGRMAIAMVSHDMTAISALVTGIVSVDGTVCRRDTRLLAVSPVNAS